MVSFTAIVSVFAVSVLIACGGTGGSLPEEKETNGGGSIPASATGGGASSAVSQKALKLDNDECIDPPLESVLESVSFMNCEGAIVTGKLASSADSTNEANQSNQQSSNAQQASYEECSETLEEDCIATAEFPAVEIATVIAADILTGKSIAGVDGTAEAESHENCSSDGEQNCIVTGNFKAADVVSNALAANIKSGVTIAGVAGSYVASIDDCSADGELNCKSTANFPAFDVSGLSADSICFGSTVAGVEGTNTCVGESTVNAYVGFPETYNSTPSLTDESLAHDAVESVCSSTSTNNNNVMFYYSNSDIECNASTISSWTNYDNQSLSYSNARPNSMPPSGEWYLCNEVEMIGDNLTRYGKNGPFQYSAAFDLDTAAGQTYSKAGGLGLPFGTGTFDGCSQPAVGYYNTVNTSCTDGSLTGWTEFSTIADVSASTPEFPTNDFPPNGEYYICIKYTQCDSEDTYQLISGTVTFTD